MTNFVNSSALTKLLAAVFIFILLLAAVGIAIFDTVQRLAVPDYIVGLIEGGLLASATILGVHLGGVQTLAAQTQNVSTSLPPVDQQVTAKVPKVP